VINHIFFTTDVFLLNLYVIMLVAWGSVVVKASSRTVPGSIPGGVTGDFFFRGSFRQNHVP